MVAFEGHRSPRIEGFRRIPYHSPELQPSERLWPLSDEAVANRHFEGIEDMEEALVERCMSLGEQPEVIRSYLRYHWWPRAA